MAYNTTKDILQAALCGCDAGKEIVQKPHLKPDHWQRHSIAWAAASADCIAHASSYEKFRTIDGSREAN
jgi:hypothetical protein